MITVKMRKSDNAIINIIDVPCNCDGTCPKDDYCYRVIIDYREFAPPFTLIKWVYNQQTNDFECTNTEMTWED